MKIVNNLLAIAVFSCVAFSCQREPLQEKLNGQEEGWFLTFTAESGEDDAATKTSLGEDESSILWSVGDKINVFYGTAFGGEFTSTNEEPVAKAEFEGTLTAFSGAVEGGVGANPFWAVYPYSKDNMVKGDGVITSLPASQTAVSRTFMNGALLSVAKSEHLGLAFYNVCGGVKFSVTQSGIQQVALRGNNGEALAGRVSVKMNAEGRPEITEVEDPQTTIKLTAPKGTYFEPGQMYYIVCLPVELTQGFTLTMMSESKTGVYEHPDPVTVKRAVFGRLADVDSDVNYVNADNRIYPGPRDNEIWYTTEDGEVCGPVSNSFHDFGNGSSEVMACFGANLVSNTYQDGKGVMVFDGPVCFIRADKYNCSPFVNTMTESNLTEIWLPDSVVELYDYAFHWCDSLREVHLSENLVSIGPDAFSFCSRLKSLTIPDSVSSIGAQAFWDCSALQEVVFSVNLKSIGSRAFSDCSGLNEITLPESLVSIGDYAFNACMALKEITIPSHVTNIGEGAFANCISLYKVNILSPNVAFNGNPFCGVSLFEFTGTYASADHRSLVKDGKLLAVAAAGLLNYTVPEEVSVIGAGAFQEARSLGSIYLSDSVSEIESGAFSGCMLLTSIQLPSTMTCIEDGMFSGCSSLRWVTIPEGVTRIGNFAFSGCASLRLKNDWGSNALPQSVTSIGDNAFQGCAITEVDLPANLTSIGSGAFSDCPLTEVSIPEGVTSLGGKAFNGCSKLTTVRFLGTGIKFPDDETPSSIRNPFTSCSSLSAFLGEIVSEDHKSIVQDGTLIAVCAVGQDSIEIPEGITAIGSGAFFGMSGLTEIKIPEGVTSIGRQAFEGCNLTNLVLPKSIEMIGRRPLGSNSKIQSVTLKATVPPQCQQLGHICFPGSYPVYVQKTSLEAYQSDANWSTLGDRLQAMPIDDGGHEMVHSENW